MQNWDVVVVGGGVAGCSAAIFLAQSGFSTLVLEQSRYPGRKLCGEFLSMEATGYLDAMGALGAVERTGAAKIDELRMVASNGASMAGALPGSALGVTRSALDMLLANRARECGAVVTEGARVLRIGGSPEGGFLVATTDGTIGAKCVLAASGRRAAPGTGEQAKPGPFVAFKAHYRGAHSANAIELFGFRGGYVGVAPVEGQLVNACFIAHRSALVRASGRVDRLICNAQQENSALGEHMASLTQVDKAVGCSDIRLGPRSPCASGMLNIGDAAGMIAPLCGDGMSMAMRSARIAVDCAVASLKGEIDPRRCRRLYAARWRREFFLRLAVGRALQSVAIHPAAANLALRACESVPALAGILIRATRGDVSSSASAAQTRPPAGPPSDLPCLRSSHQARP